MNSNDDKRITELIEQYFLGFLSEDEADELNCALLVNQPFRDRFRRAARLDAELRHVADEGNTSAVSGAEVCSTRTRYRGVMWGALAASILLAVGLALSSIISENELENDPRIIAAGDVIGDVHIVGLDGTTREALAGDSIASRETIRLSGEESLARVTYPDTTSVILVNNSSATLTHEKAKQVDVHRGTLVVHVANQPRNRPMILTTSQARVDVLGTDFLLTASDDATDLAVERGKVRVTRTRDAKSVIVDGGNKVVSNSSPELLVSKVKPTPVKWSMGFEDGVPAGWHGVAVQDGLPKGSHGAIQAVSDPKMNNFTIRAAQKWNDGYFMAHEDTHMHIIFKVENPNWINIFSLTRNEQFESSLYMCNSGPFHEAKAGVWYEMTLPITKWKRKDFSLNRFIEGNPPSAKEIFYEMALSNVGEDRGLVVDRIWIARGGPGEVEMTKLEIPNDEGNRNDQ